MTALCCGPRASASMKPVFASSSLCMLARLTTLRVSGIDKSHWIQTVSKLREFVAPPFVLPSIEAQKASAGDHSCLLRVSCWGASGTTPTMLESTWSDHQTPPPCPGTCALSYLGAGRPSPQYLRLVSCQDFRIRTNKTCQAFSDLDFSMQVVPRARRVR